MAKDSCARKTKWEKALKSSRDYLSTLLGTTDLRSVGIRLDAIEAHAEPTGGSGYAHDPLSRGTSTRGVSQNLSESLPTN